MHRIVYRVLKDGGGPEYLSHSKYHVVAGPETE